MMNIPAELEILFNKYYSDNPKLLATVLIHSECVARKAIECIIKKNLPVDKNFIYKAALLHDIGVVKCNAPDIYCVGEKPYICHGIEGAIILHENGFEQFAPFCERHTGSGLTKEEIQSRNLPLPHKDMIPLTLEEKIICYADKFYSKSGDLRREKTFNEIIAQLSKHGETVVERILELHNFFN